MVLKTSKYEYNIFSKTERKSKTNKYIKIQIYAATIKV